MSETTALLPVGATDLDTALAAARQALVPLRATTPLDRGRALVAVASDLEDRRAQLVRLVRRATGGRFSDAVEVVDGLVDDTLRWAGWADKLDLLVPGWPDRTRGPGVVLVPAGRGSVRDTTGAVCAVLLTGGTCLLAEAGRPTGLLAAAVLAQFPAGAVAVVPPPAEGADPRWRTTDAGPATDADRVQDLLDVVPVAFGPLPARPPRPPRPDQPRPDQPRPEAEPSPGEDPPQKYQG